MKERIRSIIEQAAQQGTGLLGVGFKDLTTGEEVYLNGDTAFPTASVFKIFVLCELFRREKEGTFSFDQQHTLLNSEKSIGSGILELIGEGAVFSMMDLIMLMMSISDNTATKLLQRNVDNTFVTPVFNGSASLRDAAGQRIENVAKSTRRKQTVDEEYMTNLYGEVNSLYRLDQLETGGSQRDLGPLPGTAVLLLGLLAVAWLGIGAYFMAILIKNKKLSQKH